MNIRACLLFAGAVLGAILPPRAAAAERLSQDAYIRSSPGRWVLGTALVEKTLVLEEGRFQMAGWVNKAAKRQLGSGGGEEFFAGTGGTGGVSGMSGGWTLDGERTRALKQGELALEISLKRDGLRVTKTYEVFPGSSVIREQTSFENIGQQPRVIREPGFYCASFQGGGPEALDFHWMSGGENRAGSWVLKTEALAPGKPRVFDSYDPFPGTQRSFPGDGVNVAIFRNNHQVWPPSGWQASTNALDRSAFDFRLTVAPGDILLFRANMRGSIGWDTTAFDPTLVYEDGQTHTASREFSSRQATSGWRYQYWEKDQWTDLVYYTDRDQWRKAADNATGTPFVSAGAQHPGQGQDVARVWTAPKAGSLRVAGSVCNTGNRETGLGSGGVRMGSSSYAPWTSLYNRQTGDGVFFGWDYFGRWTSSYALGSNGAVAVGFRVAGFEKTLAPGETVTGPKAFCGLYQEDLDNAGNECLNWQYRYLWDYTRENWFPAVRALHGWANGTGWGLPGTPWTGGQADAGSVYRMTLRIADFMRLTGADVYHRDWGWWDRAGDWNGPDFRGMNDYLGKHGMGLLIYAFLYTVDPLSQVARQHPEWVLGGNTLDMSRPEVVEFISRQLDSFARRWGPFEWRNDSDPICPSLGDDTPLLGQDQGLRQIIRGFLDRHPDCAFQAVNGGGNCAGYDYVRYASSFQFSDGAVGILRNYWTALLFPPDKVNDQPDVSNPDQFNKALWRGSLCCNFDTTGDTFDPAKLDGLRELNDIYHYLQTQGVVGRWVRVYRPKVRGDDPTLYFQRLSRDGLRALIIPKRPAPGPVTICPKGLVPTARYLVSYQESAATQERAGADLMENGIALQSMPPGELVYLNLPFHPGNRLDTRAPSAPKRVTVRAAANIGFPGVEIRWQPGADDRWLSCHEVFRDGLFLGKAAKGAFFFDHSAGADPAALYEARAVDGSGNASPKAAARPAKGPRARVTDSAPGADVVYSPQWRHTNAPPLVAHQNTVSDTTVKGAEVVFSFEGRHVTWYAKMGADCGKAAVSIDRGPVTMVDTYAPDDLWGTGVFRRDLDGPGPHTLRIQVTGERAARSKGTRVCVDAFRAEP